MAKRYTLRLIEALELRVEYDDQIRLLFQCLPENYRVLEGIVKDSAERVRRPSREFDIVKARRGLRHAEAARSRLNQSIEEVNHRVKCVFQNQTLRLVEALEMRNRLHERLSSLYLQVLDSAYEKPIDKGGRKTSEKSQVGYVEAKKLFDQTRSSLRELNQILHRAAYENSLYYTPE